MSDQQPPPTPTQRLAKEFEGTFSAETVEAVLTDSLERLDSPAKVHTYIYLFAERFARERLNAVARSNRLSIHDQPEVLFVCVHNAGRSQMAAALLEYRGKGLVKAHSAGSAPAAVVNPSVVKAMEEIGLDISSAYPKPLTEEVVKAADLVVTMGCGDACPVFPGKRYLDWQLPDPAGKGVEDVRPIRDLIDLRVQALLAELIKAEAPA